MTVKLSTALRNQLAAGRSLREIFKDAMIHIYDGSIPATAGLAKTGNLLCTISLSAVTPVVNSGIHETWSFDFPDSHAEGATYKVTVTADGASVTYTYTNTPDAGDSDAVGKAMAECFNRLCPDAFFIYTAASRKMWASARLTSTDFTIGNGGGDVTLANFARAYEGANATGGLEFEKASAGVISIPSGDVWQGTNGDTGTASYFRLVQIQDAEGEDTTYVSPRIQGSVSTSGADMNLTSISLVEDAPTIISTFNITIPAS